MVVTQSTILYMSLEHCSDQHRENTCKHYATKPKEIKEGKEVWGLARSSNIQQHHLTTPCDWFLDLFPDWVAKAQRRDVGLEVGCGKSWKHGSAGKEGAPDLGFRAVFGAPKNQKIKKYQKKLPLRAASLWAFRRSTAFKGSRVQENVPATHQAKFPHSIFIAPREACWVETSWDNGYSMLLTPSLAVPVGREGCHPGHGISEDPGKHREELSILSPNTQ